MRNPYIPTLSMLLLLAACSNSGSYSKAESASDAGREFVRGFLDGDHKKAFFYLLKDSTNELLFETQKADYLNMPNDEKRNFKESSIRPVEIKEQNDSTTTFRYYHSAKPKDTTLLRIVKKNDEWLVDLKSVIKM